MRWLGVSVGLIWLLMRASLVEAARTVTITANKSALFGDEELTATMASMSGFIDGEGIYIKGAFYQEGSSNYFGWTKKGDNWIKNGETTTNQRQVTVGSWDGMLVVKSDFSDSGYTGEGDYKFKVGFYYITSGGNVSSVNWSTNNLTISLSEPDPTPTPTPTPTATPTPTPTPTSTASPTPKPSLTPTPTIKASPSPQVLAAAVATEAEKLPELVTSEAVVSPTAMAESEIEKKKESKSSIVPIIIGGGVALSLVGLFPLVKKWYHGQSWQKSSSNGGDQFSSGQE